MRFGMNVVSLAFRDPCCWPSSVGHHRHTIAFRGWSSASISSKADTILPELDRWATLIRQLGG
jgi:hypothetical protein